MEAYLYGGETEPLKEASPTRVEITQNIIHNMSLIVAITGSVPHITSSIVETIIGETVNVSPVVEITQSTTRLSRNA